jgi:hypothetical protein
LLHPAVGIDRQAAADRAAIDEWKSKKLRLEPEGDDGEEGDQRERTAQRVVVRGPRFVARSANTEV